MSLATYLSSRRLVQILLDDDIKSEDDDEDDIPSQGNPQPNVFPRNPVHPEHDRRYSVQIKHPVDRYGHNIYKQ